jgi:hypothetical protein
MVTITMDVAMKRNLVFFIRKLIYGFLPYGIVSNKMKYTAIACQ